jgi:hypothetical protein
MSLIKEEIEKEFKK